MRHYKLRAIQLLRERHWQPRSLKAGAGQTERMVAALCHISLVVNIFTFVGGIVLCLVAYLIAQGGAEFLAKQAGKALVAQIIVWALVAPVWLVAQGLPDWLGAILLWPWSGLIWFIAIIVGVWRAVRCL